MNPQRLAYEDATEFERRLLSAAAREQPSPNHVRRMRRAIGLAGGFLSTTSVGTAVLALPKLAALAVVAAGFTGNASSVIRKEPSDTPALQGSLPVDAAARSRSARTTPVRSVPQPAAVEGSQPIEGNRITPTSRARARPSDASPAVAPRTFTDVRAEVRALDRARGLLQQGNSAACLAELERYKKAYPEGLLRQEATVLRVEALNRAGERAAAESAANSLLREHPDSPYRDRVKKAVHPSSTGEDRRENP